MSKIVYSFGVLISFLELLVDDGFQQFFPFPVLLLHLLGLSDSVVFDEKQLQLV